MNIAASCLTSDRPKRLLATLMVLSTFFVACGPDEGAEPTAAGTAVRIAAAADLQFALEDLIADFAQVNPEARVNATYGSSGTFYAQLQNEAPFDLYLSADLSYPEQLQEQGLTIPDSLFSYAVGRIVVWVRKDSPVDVESLEMDALLDPSVQKIAIADPEHAPYGRAAVAAMRSYGVYERVKGQLVLGESIAQTAQFVESGAADIGIIALSLAVVPEAEGRYWEISPDQYPTIEQGGVIMRWARDPEGARSFVDFMLSSEGTEILARYGFTPPKD
jgi:molybdate transport system substrate-binding protein